MATRTKTRTSERSTQTRHPRIAAVQRLTLDSIAEMKKITWPDREALRNLTLFVIALSAALGLVLGGVDAAFIRLWDLL